MSAPKYTFCHSCERGGNGTDKDKCSCGWQIKSRANKSGCYIGTPIKPRLDEARTIAAREEVRS